VHFIVHGRSNDGLDAAKGRSWCTALGATYNIEVLADFGRTEPNEGRRRKPLRNHAAQHQHDRYPSLNYI